LSFARQVLFHWTTSPALRYFLYSLSFIAHGQPQTTILLLITSQEAVTTDTHHYDQLTDWDEVSITFCPGWPQIVILWIDASPEARITGKSSQAQQVLNFKSSQ
jgi:hypothetical protein